MIRGILLGSIAAVTVVTAVIVAVRIQAERDEEEAARQALIDLGAVEVVYRVTADGRGGADVMRMDVGETLVGPWSRRLPVTDHALAMPGDRVYVSASGDVARGVSCTISINGDVVAEETGEGDVVCEATAPG
ncbi:hypothetical protein MTQ13_08670 [Streptomyces sp. XM4011]|uniref:hypothetical protein n=1 Tax=Streptomyces sp. XM4011 TaxID=2929780 RepID=UPI001FFBC3D6|nr:hypothetical protein [Streptomyces sp. XM4011]MCK1814350.1 hypothetical protein [Streptomyces sp. XM4011]